MTELLPCPFCGGEAVIRVDATRPYPYRDRLRVGCETAGCRGFYHAAWVYYETPEQAAEAWNTRLASATAYRRNDEYGDVLRVVVRGRYPERIEAELDGNVRPFFRQQTCRPEEQYLDSHSDLTVTVCSECGVPTDDLEDCNYCPNCGRRVVG